jgi:hypothetical protein
MIHSTVEQFHKHFCFEYFQLTVLLTVFEWFMMHFPKHLRKVLEIIYLYSEVMSDDAVETLEKFAME